MGRSWDEIKAQKRPARDEVPLALDPALAQAYAEAQQKVDETRQALEFRPGSAERQERIADAERALEEAREALEPSLVYFSRCVVDPELTMSQAKELWAGGVFSQGEVEFLFTSCLNVNQQARVVDLGKESRRTGSSGSSSASALTTA
jgi:hypothetical protein